MNSKEEIAVIKWLRGMLSILLSMSLISMYVNSIAATEKRAMSNIELFLSSNGLKAKRKTCSGDSNSSGYSDCAVVLNKGERIKLKCVSSFVPTLVGATGCKEIFTDINYSIGIK